MARGRKRTPTKKKQLIDTLRKDRMLGDEWEPKEIDTIPMPPPGHGFDEESLRLWYRLLLVLSKPGILTVVDTEQLFIYVTCLQLHREMWLDIQNEGKVLVNANSGVSYINPKIRIANMQATTAMRIASEYGFTPSSRTRIGTGGGKKDKGHNDEFPDIG